MNRIGRGLFALIAGSVLTLTTHTTLAAANVSAKPIANGAAAIKWQNWDPALFARARSEHRYVILDLQAIWCHWCHVMDEVTYRDAAVAQLIGDHYIAVRVDQDADPALSSRYEDYGWPATIVFAPDGTEIVKRQGYIPPTLMTALLQGGGPRYVSWYWSGCGMNKWLRVVSLRRVRQCRLQVNLCGELAYVAGRNPNYRTPVATFH